MTGQLAGIITKDGAVPTGDAWAGLASLLLAEKKRRCRENFHEFAGFCMRDEKGRAVTQESLHRVMQLHISTCWAAGLHAAVLAPFGHGKTVQLPVGRVCWELGKDPTLRFKIVCNNDKKAMERVMGCTALMFSDAYQLVFPEIRPVPQDKARRQRKQAKMTQHEVYLDRPGQALDASIQAAGVLSGGTGGRCDVMAFDDIVDQKNALDEPTMRAKVIANMENVWMERLAPNGRAFYVGTPWHQADATHKLMDNPEWCVLCCKISDDFQRIELEVYNPPDDYPLPRLSGAASPASGRMRGWVKVDSSNVRAVRYDQAEQQLTVAFLSGGVYRYRDVPRSLFDSLLAADSIGAFLNQNVKGVFPCERVNDGGAVKRFTDREGGP